MKKYCLILITPLLFAFKPIGGIVGKQFPTMVCEDYTGKQVTLPDLAKGKFTLIGMAFSSQAEKDLKTWIDPIYNTFVPKKKDPKEEVNPFDVSESYDINLYFVPMFTKANQLLGKSAKEKIKTNTDPDLYQYLLFYEGANTYKEELDFEKKDVPYFFVIDKSGKIVYTTFGAYTENKLDDITDALNEEE